MFVLTFSGSLAYAILQLILILRHVVSYFDIEDLTAESMPVVQGILIA